MKKLLLFFFFAMPFLASAQYTDTIMPYRDGRILYEQIEGFPEIDKNKMYALTKQWLVKVFPTYQAIQSEDIETGQIIAKGRIRADYLNLFYNMQIDCKDGKYRFRIYNVNNTLSTGREYPFEGKMLDKMNDRERSRLHSIVKSADEQFNAILKHFSEYIHAEQTDDF